LRILGLDPGLGTTGWGLIEADGNRLGHVANGQLKTDSAAGLPRRLAHLAGQLDAVLADHRPDAAAVEEVFVNKNPQSTLKLPVEARPAVHAMVEKGVLGGVSLGRLYPGVEALENGLVVAVTETASDEDIAALEAALKEACA
jgi:crossover junction endodeoxyribonuclease RuvC